MGKELQLISRKEKAVKEVGREKHVSLKLWNFSANAKKLKGINSWQLQWQNIPAYYGLEIITTVKMFKSWHCWKETG